MHLLVYNGTHIQNQA